MQVGREHIAAHYPVSQECVRNPVNRTTGRLRNFSGHVLRMVRPASAVSHEEQNEDGIVCVQAPDGAEHFFVPAVGNEHELGSVCIAGQGFPQVTPPGALVRVRPQNYVYFLRLGLQMKDEVYGPLRGVALAPDGDDFPPGPLPGRFLPTHPGRHDRGPRRDRPASADQKIEGPLVERHDGVEFFPGVLGIEERRQGIEVLAVLDTIHVQVFLEKLERVQIMGLQGRVQSRKEAQAERQRPVERGNNQNIAPGLPLGENRPARKKQQRERRHDCGAKPHSRRCGPRFHILPREFSRDRFGVRARRPHQHAY